MDALEFMARFHEMAGQGAPVVLFSAFRISETFGITVWNARKIVETLRNCNLTKRVGNQYLFNRHGLEAVRAMTQAKSEVY
jgi:hypothetical protein